MVSLSHNVDNLTKVYLSGYLKDKKDLASPTVQGDSLCKNPVTPCGQGKGEEQLCVSDKFQIKKLGLSHCS